MSMTPTTRLEKWLAKIAGESVDIQPKDRLETLLAKIAGESVSITPDDSLEYWLNQIAENGGGGGSSDFSTATVTLNLTMPTGVSNEGTTVTSEISVDAFAYTGSINANSTNTSAEILLYKGSANITSVEAVGSDSQPYVISNLSAAVLSGNITYDLEQGVLLVTGDCSITATLESGGK